MGMYLRPSGGSNPFDSKNRLQTHYSGCWRNHPECAIKKLEQLLKFLNFIKKKVDAQEIIKIIEG